MTKSLSPFFLSVLLLTACSGIEEKYDNFAASEKTSEKIMESKEVSVNSGLESNTINVSESSRSYLTYMPETQSGSMPVIIDFHGGTGTAEGQYFTSSFFTTADTQGILLVYPQAETSTGSVWNTLHSVDGNKVSADDFAFIQAIIDSLHSNRSIDKSRIYVSGYSNGAAMAFQIACHLNDDIAGFVVMSGLFPLEDDYPCNITHETAGIIITGTSDTERPMEGINGYALPVREAAAWWADQNNSIYETVVQEGNIERTIYETSSGTQIQLFVVDGGGHDWFNFDVDDMPMNLFIWNFFSDYRS